MRVLIQVEPAYLDQVKAELRPMGITPITQVFDYLTVEIPEEVVPSIRRLPYVIDVRPEKKKEIMLVPIDKKLSEFRRLFLSNPLTGPFSAFNFSRTADEGKVKWLTSESRKMVGADIAEAEGITGAGVKVAVIDTGADPTCVQLPGLWGMSSVEGQPIPLDENGHSTHCATTIAGKPFSTPYGEIKGVAPDAQLGIFKALGYGMGAGTETSVMRAMMDAFTWGADIISMSLGSPYSEESTDVIPECRAVKMLTQQGIIVVIANGNDGLEPRTVGVAACSPYALSVGAVDRRGRVAEFSSRGPTQEDLIKPDVSAPGVDILSSTVGLIDIMQFMDGIKLGCISGTCANRDSFVYRPRKRPISIAKIRKGDTVYTLSNNGEILPRKVAKRWCNGTKPIFEIKLRGKTIKATDNHPFLVATNSHLEWKLLKELKPSDILVTLRHVPGSDVGHRNSTPKELARLLGFMIGDGWLEGARHATESRKHRRLSLSNLMGRRPNYGVYFAHGEGEETNQRYCNLFEELFNKRPTLTKDRKWFYLYSREIHNKLSDYLTGDALKKRVPDWIYGAPNSWKEEFIRGYLDADGTHYKGWTVESPNEELVRDLHELAIEAGLRVSNIGKRQRSIKAPNSKTPKEKDYFSFHMGDRKMKIGCDLPPGTGRWSFTRRNGLSYERIRTIRPCGEEKVYDIEVEGAHNFIANGFIVHNSMATPHVSGVVALAVQYAKIKGKKLTTEAIKTAMAMYGKPKNNDTGWGIIAYPCLREYIDKYLGVPPPPVEEELPGRRVGPPEEEEAPPPAAEFIVS